MTAKRVFRRREGQLVDSVNGNLHVMVDPASERPKFDDVRRELDQGDWEAGRLLLQIDAAEIDVACLARWLGSVPLDENLHAILSVAERCGPAPIARVIRLRLRECLAAAKGGTPYQAALLASALMRRRPDSSLAARVLARALNAGSAARLIAARALSSALITRLDTPAIRTLVAAAKDSAAPGVLAQAIDGLAVHDPDLVRELVDDAIRRGDRAFLRIVTKRLMPASATHVSAGLVEHFRGAPPEFRADLWPHVGAHLDAAEVAALAAQSLNDESPFVRLEAANSLRQAMSDEVVASIARAAIAAEPDLLIRQTLEDLASRPARRTL